MSTYKIPEALSGMPNYGQHGLGTAKHSQLAALFPNSPSIDANYTAGLAANKETQDVYTSLDEAMMALVGIDSSKEITAENDRKPKISSISMLPGQWSEVPSLSFKGPTASKTKDIQLGNKIPNAGAPNKSGAPANPATISDLETAPAPSELGATGKAQPGTGDYSTVKPIDTIVRLGSYLKTAILGQDTDGKTLRWDSPDESPNQYATLTVIEKDPPKKP